MKKNFRQWVLEKVLSNYELKFLIYGLMKTPLVTKNPLYKHYYKKNVRNKIKCMAEKPQFVIIENTNHCNLSCVFCANPTMNRSKGFMSRELFDSIINQCKEMEIENVLIQGYGEPLLDRDYIAKVKFAKNRGIKYVHCVTNGTLLDNNIAEKLVNAGLDYLYISIDAATAETYNKIHGTTNDKFDKLVENIINLSNIKKSRGTQKPLVELRFKEFDLTKGERKAFMQRFLPVADKINVYLNITNWPGSDIESSIPKNAPLMKFPCYNLWSTIYVAHDGGIPICCQDFECSTIIGNLNEESIVEVWKGEKLTRLRELHLTEEFDQIPVCKVCVINTQYVYPWW